MSAFAEWSAPVDEPAQGVYPVTISLLDWLHEAFGGQSSEYPDGGFFEKSVFDKWREILPVKRVVEDTVRKGICKYIAQSKLKQYNREAGLNLTYEEVLGADASSWFSPAGEWVCFSDRPEEILLGEFDDPDMAIYGASERVKWAVVWHTSANAVAVYRSPCVGRRMLDEEGDLVHGLRGGEIETFVLHPMQEANIRHDLMMEEL